MQEAEMVFESELNEEANRLEDLIKQLKEQEFDPKEYLSEHFSRNCRGSEDQMIDAMIDQLEQVNNEVAKLEREVNKEATSLNTELEVSQDTCTYEMDHFMHEFRDIKNGVKDLKEVIGVEEQQIRTVGEELREINKLRNEKLCLRELINVLNGYESKGEEYELLKIDVRNGETDALLKLECLKCALETLNFEEYRVVKEEINLDFIEAKKNTLKNFKNLLEEAKYEEAKELYTFMKQAGNLDETEDVYVRKVIDAKNETAYTYTKQNIEEFKRYLFNMSRVLTEVNDREGMLWHVHDGEAIDVADRIMIKIMRKYVCHTATRVMNQSIEHNNSTFFLDYLDSFNKEFEEFMIKCKKMENTWSICESINEAYKDTVEKFQDMYFNYELTGLKNYLTQTIDLKFMEIKKAGTKETDESKREDKKLEVIVAQLNPKKIGEIVTKSKISFNRCLRNSLGHNVADNCGDMLILFMNQMASYITKIIETAEQNAPSTQDKEPARLQIFSVVQSVLSIIKNFEMLFNEFKETITNIFKLDEADKTRQQIMKMLSERISKTLNLAMRNLFAHLAQIWKIHKKKKKKKDNLEESATAKAIESFLGEYLDFIMDNFSMEQKTNLMRVIGLEFMKFLERMIPQEKYSQNDILQLNVDIKFYEDEVIEHIEEPDVDERMEKLKLLVGLLQVPWESLEATLEENDMFKTVEKVTLDAFLRCIKRMKKKKK